VYGTLYPQPQERLILPTVIPSPAFWGKAIWERTHKHKVIGQSFNFNFGVTLSKKNFLGQAQKAF
jgi:hypothetical protein